MIFIRQKFKSFCIFAEFSGSKSDQYQRILVSDVLFHFTKSTSNSGIMIFILEKGRFPIKMFGKNKICIELYLKSCHLTLNHIDPTAG